MTPRSAWLALSLILPSCAPAPTTASAAAPSMEAALRTVMASAQAAGPSVRCERRGAHPLAFSCVEQLDRDHFSSVNVEAVRLAAVPSGERGRVSADDPVIGPGGGGGRYAITTRDGAYRVTAVEFQRLMRGQDPRLPSANRMLTSITAAYDAGPMKENQERSAPG